ncbi:SpoIIE family protein phosphatase [Mycobacterium sp. 23]|uniref:SpoIIE family protein phosphatase n=1 Tax=Mycobacterium sp. 23 TaxID=3400424 RepID=UPI003AAD4F2F
MPPDRLVARIPGLAARSLGMPMAAVSIVAEDDIFLIATHGPPAVGHIPREEGLCASAVTNSVPYVVHDASSDPRTADNRFVRAHRVRFYACAPIVTFDGFSLGTVAVMDTDVRTVSDEQLSVLQDLAAIVMEQLDLRLASLDALGVERGLRSAAEDARDDARFQRYRAQEARDVAQRERDDARQDRDVAIRDRNTAEYDRDLTEEYAAVLQQTLLPPMLPTVEGASLAAYYHPASPRRVGGDFYDVFALGGDRWAFFIGDVEGHGVDAAVVTSLIRYTLRSAALHYSDPIDGLVELNAVLLRELDPRRFCTVLFGTLQRRPDDRGFSITIATGGHPPALLLDPRSGTAAEVRSDEGTLVGLRADAKFHTCDVILHPGQTLLFYTDGIVEARRGANPFNEGSLAAFAAEHAGPDASSLIDELATLIPKLGPQDDIALLAISAH